MQKQVVFLGHIVSGQGIATDPEKTKLVEEWLTPTYEPETAAWIPRADRIL